MEEVDPVARYMQARFHACITKGPMPSATTVCSMRHFIVFCLIGGGQQVNPTLVTECNQICANLATAYENRSTSAFTTVISRTYSLIAVRIPWDAERYGSRIHAGPAEKDHASEVPLAKVFPPLKTLEVHEPSIVMDRHDRIIAWLLPDLLSEQRQVITRQESW